MEDKRKIEEDEIDLLALLQTLWNGRKTVVKFVAILGLIGLFVALFSPKEYTASTMIVPVASQKTGGSLSGLAAMAGINIGGAENGSGISPTLYPNVVESIPFKRELLETPIKVSESAEKITFRKYHEEVYGGGVLAWLKKYTIGLPGTLLGWFKESSKEVEILQDTEAIIVISFEEAELMKILEETIEINVNEKDDYVTLSANMPEALAAAQMAEKAQQLLQKYVIKFKSQKAKEQLQFVEERYKEKAEEFRRAEMALARFKDRNRNVATATAMTEEKRLTSEYNLLYSVCTELAKRVETQKIQVKENTPVFTVIEPVTVPTEKSKPKRALILIIWLFLGFVLGVGVVFGREFVRNLKEQKAA